jgi:cytoskeletal protein CcmA (bactofilin family)
MGQDLSVNGNVDICNTLNVLNALTRLSDLSAYNVEISSGLIYNTTIGLTNPADASFAYVTVGNDLAVSGRSDFNSDVSINNGSSLTVANNISGGSTLHIGGRADFNSDVSLNTSLTVANNIHTSRILITSSVTDISNGANIQGDISAGGNLDISNNAIIGGDLTVKGQNLYLSNATTSDTFDSSYSYIYGGNTIVIDPLAQGDTSGTVIIEGGLTVKGTTTTINSTTLDISDTNITLASSLPSTTLINMLRPGIDISNLISFSVIRDTEQLYNTEASFQSLVGAQSDISNLKWKTNLGIYASSDISASSGTIDTNLNVGSLLTSNTLQVNTNNLVVNSTNVSTNLPLSVTGDISSNSYLYVQNYIHNIGDVSLVGSRFTITQTDVSMSQNVFMGQDLSVNRNVDICNTLTVLNNKTTLSDLSALTVQIFDGSINSTEIGLTTPADASFNYVTISDELYVGSDVKTLNNNAIITNTYSAFKLPEISFVKEDKFVHSSSLDNSGDKWYDLSDSGFKLDYTNGQSLLSRHSFVKIDVKLNFVASNEAEQFISFRLMEGSVPIKHDLSLGSVFGIGSRGIYQSSFLHAPDKTNPVYSLQFFVQRGVDETIDISSGVIIDPSSTYFYAQELYRPISP